MQNMSWLPACGQAALRVLARMLGVIFALPVIVTVAMADCASDCDNGFNVCMRNCGGQAGCLETCSRGRSGCLRRCGQSENFTHVPFRIAIGGECPAGSGRNCNDTTPYCCIAADGTAYCAKDTTGCTR
jgi:hypothetical protein